MPEPLRIFGYGSLMYEPCAPHLLEGWADATLVGWRRAFNKRSGPRGCFGDEALVHPGLVGWIEEPRRVSLALGTEPDEGSVIEGKVLLFPASATDEVLAELDIREGVTGPEANLGGYRREVVTVEGPEGPVEAVTYLTNLDGPLHVRLGIEETAEVLVAATPKHPGERARGADYLVGAIAVLMRAGVEDRGMEVLAAAVRERLPEGRWEAAVSRWGW